jgi:opacity protein-like surface antigen
MYRRILTLVCCILTPSVASAQGMGGYLEGNVGAAFIGDVDAHVTTSPSGTVGIDYGTELLFGVEGGIRGLGNANNIRLGVSWDHANADLDSIRVSGFGLSGGASVDCSLLESEAGFDVCSELDESVNIISANAYLDLAMGNQMGVQPYIGVGIGYAFFDNADDEFALSGTAGVRIPVGMNAYIGGRYRYQWISAPTGGQGVEFDDVSIHGLTATVGINF